MLERHTSTLCKARFSFPEQTGLLQLAHADPVDAIAAAEDGQCASSPPSSLHLPCPRVARVPYTLCRRLLTLLVETSAAK